MEKNPFIECLASKCFSHVVFFFGDIGVKVPRFCGEDSSPYEGASPSRGGGLIFKLENCYRRDVDRSVLIMATRLTACSESMLPGTTPPLPTPATSFKTRPTAQSLRFCAAIVPSEPLLFRLFGCICYSKCLLHIVLSYNQSTF